MKELMTVTDLVKSILENDERCRKNDGLLWLRVLEKQSAEKGTDMRFLTVDIFLPNITDLGFTPFETVRRCRQAIQAKYPHLAADAHAKQTRKALEEEYREYARAMK